jgi:hypothetical protein
MGSQFKPSGSYSYVGYRPSTPQPGTAERSEHGRGPIDVYLLNSASITLSATDGSTDVELKANQGTICYIYFHASMNPTYLENHHLIALRYLELWEFLIYHELVVNQAKSALKLRLLGS